MASRKALLIIAAASVAIVVGALLLLPAATAWPNNHVVGETDGWQLGVDYNYWACWVNTGIPVGDTLGNSITTYIYVSLCIHDDVGLQSDRSPTREY
jgi:hypothetical protein